MRLLSFFMLTLVITLTATQQVLAVTKTWVGANSSGWGSAANWSPSGVPANADDVIIPSGTTWGCVLNNNVSYTRTGNTTLQGATLSWGSGASIINSGVFTLASGATIEVSGTFTNQSAGSIALSGSGTFISIAVGTLSNAGTITIGAGTLIFISSTIVSSFSNSGTINNSGSLILYPGNNGNNTFTNTGTINNLNDGVVEGIGTISSTSFINPTGGKIGGLFDDASAGVFEQDCLSFSGGLTNNGIVRFGVSGTTACTDHNRIAVSGAMAFGGTFTATGTGALNSTVTLMTYASRTGTFTNSNASMGGGKYLNIRAADYGATALTAKIESSPVLSVEMAEFSVHTEGGKNKLTWTTANEINSYAFEVERSSDGKTFTKIGTVKAQGKAATYQFIDNQPIMGTTYYRLNQTDNDQTSEYSKVISVTNKGGKALKVYPTLVSNGFLTVDSEVSDYAIYNIVGQQVQSGKTAQRLDVSALAKGTYILKVGTEQAKFVKQ